MVRLYLILIPVWSGQVISSWLFKNRNYLHFLCLQYIIQVYIHVEISTKEYRNKKDRQRKGMSKHKVEHLYHYLKGWIHLYNLQGSLKIKLPPLWNGFEVSYQIRTHLIFPMTLFNLILNYWQICLYPIKTERVPSMLYWVLSGKLDQYSWLVRILINIVSIFFLQIIILRSV